MHTDNADPGAIADIVPRAEAYLAVLDRALPGRITGFLITGSSVLGNWRPGLSDLDFLAMCDTRIAGNEFEILAGAHRTFRAGRRKPKLDGAFVTWEELSRDPRGLSVPRVRDGVFIPSNGYVANPVAWMTVARRPWVIRGPEAPKVWSDETALDSWCRENLEGYWRDWVGKARREPRSMLYSLSAEAAYWGVLGVARIHATIATGSIISKGAAAEWARSRFASRWGGLIDWAAKYRAGGGGAFLMPPAKRRRQCLDFMDEAIADALALPVRPGLRSGQGLT